MVCVTLVLEESPPLRGYGCLFPEQEGFESLGILWPRAMFPNHGSLPIERWLMLYNATDSEAMLLEKVEADRVRLYGKQPSKPLKVHVHYWPEALPHMTVALEEGLPELLEIHHSPGRPSIALHGNYLGAMGTTDILFISKELAESLSQSMLD
jgi:protoporphyrinogen oxidase